MTAGAADLLLLATNAVYGTAYAAQRVALDAVPPGLLGFARLAVAAIVLDPFLRRPPDTRAAPGDGLKIFRMGVLGFGVTYALSHFGMNRSTATNAALLVTLEPVAMILLSPVLLGERLRRREAMGAALVLAGAVIVVLNGVPGVTVSLLPHWRGDVLIVLGAVAFASYSLLGRDVLVQPVVGVALGVWLLGEPRTADTVFGALLVLSGLLVTSTDASK